MPVLRPSKQFGVPENTLRDRVLGKIYPETVTKGREGALVYKFRSNNGLDLYVLGVGALIC